MQESHHVYYYNPISNGVVKSGTERQCRDYAYLHHWNAIKGRISTNVTIITEEERINLVNMNKSQLNSYFNILKEESLTVFK